MRPPGPFHFPAVKWIRHMYRGTSLSRTSTPPWDHHRALGIVLLEGAGGRAVSYEQGTNVRQSRPDYGRDSI